MHQKNEGSTGPEWWSLLDVALDGVILIDLNGCVEMLNRAAERMFGYRKEEAIGQQVSILIPSRYRDEQEQSLRRPFDVGEARVLGKGREIIVKRRDGTTFPAEVTLGRVDAVTPYRFVAFVRDITERCNAMKELLRREAQLNLAQEVANLGSYVVRLDLRLPEYWSPHLFQVLGLRYGELHAGIREHLACIVHPADRERLHRARVELESGLSSMDLEYRILRQDGRQCGVRHIAQILRDGESQARQEVGILQRLADRAQLR